MTVKSLCPEELRYYTCSMSSQSSLPTKIISLGRRWRVPPPLTRNQEVRLISASLAHLWPLMHPAENRNSVNFQTSIHMNLRLFMIPTLVDKKINSYKSDTLLYSTTKRKLVQHLRMTVFVCVICTVAISGITQGRWHAHLSQLSIKHCKSVKIYKQFMEKQAY